MNTQDWNEMHLSEDPAVELLRELGYTYVSPEELDSERESFKEAVLVSRLEKKLRELNPWLSAENVSKAVRMITNVPATSLMEANEKIYVSLVHGVSIEQDRGEGKKAYDVKFIDFETLKNNEFLVTRQFRINGVKESICCDVVIFVNGIPSAIIECKSPTIHDPVDKGIKQLFRYQEASDEFRDRGAPKLFETMQALISACGQKAKFATVLSEYRNFSEWKVPHPASLDELNSKYTSRLFGRTPNPQDVLIYGLLHPENLLDIVRNFIVFESVSGKTVKKICRYQQFIAVNNTVERIKKAKEPKKRGGVIWHTQGSGKSLSMLWLAVKLRRMKELENPLLVIVTDRIDLDNQIVGTFQRCGFQNPVQAEGVRHLRDMIRMGGGQTVMTTIQKFQDITDDLKSGKISGQALDAGEGRNIFVLVDEAHRTQYKNLAANMRQMLPNACFIGFTGTPIDKRDRSTIQTFGNYIHTYTIEQAVQDGATVPIFYEGRLPDIHVEGRNLDELFERYFQDYSEKDRDEIKKKYATEEIIASAPSRIEAICLDIIRHYERFIQPNGFKAQIVTANREAAVAYKEALDKLNAPPSAVLISCGYNDPQKLIKYQKNQAEERELIRSFKEDSIDRIAIIVVCDKLLTGFDAPVEQVMYIDKSLKEHTLLQAIARVNRTADKKDYGLIVDYWGISENLQEALGVFNVADVIFAMTPKTDELPRLEARHRAVMRFFEKVDKSDIEACIKILDPEDVRADFDISFRRFAQSMDMVLPDPAALKYAADLKWLGKLRNAARTRFRDASLDLSLCGAKVRRLIEEHISAKGIQKILEPVSIFSKKFDEYVESLGTPDAKASEIEHAVRHEIHVKFDENPVFFESLRERLEKIIKQRKMERISAVEELKHLSKMFEEIRSIREIAQDLGFTETEYALYELFNSDLRADEAFKVGIKEEHAPYDRQQSIKSISDDDAKKELTKRVIESLEKLAVIDWVHKEDVQREMRKQIKGMLRESGYKFEEIESLTPRIMDIAKVRLSR